MLPKTFPYTCESEQREWRAKRSRGRRKLEKSEHGKYWRIYEIMKSRRITKSRVRHISWGFIIVASLLHYWGRTDLVLLLSLHYCTIGDGLIWSCYCRFIIALLGTDWSGLVIVASLLHYWGRTDLVLLLSLHYCTIGDGLIWSCYCSFIIALLGTDWFGEANQTAARRNFGRTSRNNSTTGEVSVPFDSWGQLSNKSTTVNCLLHNWVNHQLSTQQLS